MSANTVEYSEGITSHFRDGVLHRDNDQPAVVWDDGSREWWVHGKRLRWNPTHPTEIRCNPVTKNYEIAGSRIWHNPEGLIHRISDPAVIHVDGTKEWWVSGQRFREDGLPTVETAYGDMLWHNIQGQLHRKVLPAVIGPSGPQWWINGIQQESP